MVFTPEIIYMMGNVSALLPVEWFIGMFIVPNKLPLSLIHIHTTLLCKSRYSIKRYHEPPFGYCGGRTTSSR